MSRFCLILLVPLFLFISAADIRTMEIPDAGWITVTVLAVLQDPHYEWAAAVFLILLPFSLKDMLGFGDVKLCTAMAMFAGFRIIPILQAASLAALLLILIKKGSRVRIPFAPFLCIAFLIVCTQRQFEPEGASLSGFGIDAVAGMMEVEDAADNGKSDAAAAAGADMFLVDLVVSFPDI